VEKGKSEKMRIKRKNKITEKRRARAELSIVHSQLSIISASYFLASITIEIN
jgi:hypothetical protein